MRPAPHRLVPLALVLPMVACGGSEAEPTQPPVPSGPPASEAAPQAAAEEQHAHDEEPLGTVSLGDLVLELAQGHGAVVAGEEAHLVVKLPYSDVGQTIVRAWIGSEDRTLSFVGKGQYARSHDDYDVHATAPDPLPDDPKWWIEIEQPDGTRLVGSASPILEESP